jgi:hypothetical protein
VIELRIKLEKHTGKRILVNLMTKNLKTMSSNVVIKILYSLNVCTSWLCLSAYISKSFITNYSSSVFCLIILPLYVGIEIYCAPTAEAREIWRSSMTHIALEGSCFVLSANQFCRRKDYLPSPEGVSGGSNGDISDDTIICAGGSVIISPSGTILAGPNYQGESLISADLGRILYLLYC